jgi:cytochrome c peroxidase
VPADIPVRLPARGGPALHRGYLLATALRRVLLASGIVAASALVLLLAGGTHARAAGPGDPAPLDTLPVPSPANEGDFVRDPASAVKLGKALFWDMQAGSDGRTACATCHYNAGADSRSRNQVNPSGGAFTLAGPNGSVTAGDFPLHRLADVTNRASQVTADTNNVVASQGVVVSRFAGIDPGDPQDARVLGPDPIFSVGGTPVRQTTPRNSPSVINAVFNVRNFWDGRATNDFNGVSAFGARDTGARVGRVDASGGVDQVAVSLANSSLASQAVAPPGNPVEMSADGRTLSDVGRKLLSLKPLGEQAVSASDSVLGSDADPSGRGLSTSYRALIEQAFAPDWWDSSATVPAPSGRRFSLMEFNFPLFWGLAIQAYESTLVSDQTPADRFMEGDKTAISASAQAGLDVFRGAGRCSTCHLGPDLTDATVANVAAVGLTTTDGGLPVDTGFLNIGVRPTASDPGLGGLDPFGNPLSTVRQQRGGTTDKVGGAFKVPALRNVALTAPYFHNGGQLTLRQVVDFYNRQGDFANPEQSGVLGNLGLTETQKNDLVAFLQSLTDPRVASASAPFDHPQLFVPSGAQTAADGAVLKDASGQAVDCFLQVPATGAAGGAALPQFPSFTGPCVTPPALPGGAAPAPASGGAHAPAPAPAAPAASSPAPATSRVKGTTVRHTTRCVVPRLAGHTLAGAKRMLKQHHCGLGHVTATSAHGRRMVVRGQAPKAHSRHKAGTRVRLTLRPAAARPRR